MLEYVSFNPDIGVKERVEMWRTVPENKLRNTSNIHRNRTKEIIISTQAHETLWCDGALEAT